MQGTMLCPICLAELDPTDVQSATCDTHGEFQVLYARQTVVVPETIPAIAASAPVTPVATPEAAAADAKRDLESARALAVLGLAEKPKPIATPAGTILEGKCVKHPKVDAIQNCSQCNAPMCRMCLYRSPYGKKMCPACLAGEPPKNYAVAPVATAAPGSDATALASAPSAAGVPAEVAPLAAAIAAVAQKPKVNPAVLGILCETHADEQAVFKCKICQKGVCETCDFKIGGVHLCPECVMKPRAEVSPRRFKYVVWGYICVALCIGMYVMHMNLLVFGIGTLIGVACSFSALEKRLPNSIPLWIGVVLNSLMYILLSLEILFRVFK